MTMAVRPARWLAACVLADLALRAVGVLPNALGSAGGGTRGSDLVSLLVPYAVVGCALVALSAAGTDRRGWWTALLGAGAYVQGHGIHLAADSIRAARGDAPAPIPLWADVVGPLLWAVGAALLALAVARAVALRLSPVTIAFGATAVAAWIASVVAIGSATGSVAVAAGAAAAGVPALRQSRLRLPAPRAPLGAEIAAPRRRSVAWLLAASAIAMVLTHWLRLLPLGYPAPGETRYEDFVDILTPYVVAGPALAALALTGAGRRSWALALLGATVFAQGQGLHLSSNAISYTHGTAAPAYLWDEQVGHHLWFVGLSLLVATVVQATRAHPVPLNLTSVALAVLVGLTWAANVVEGGAVPLGLALAAGFAALGWRDRDRVAGRLLLGAFSLAIVLTLAYGVWQGGFPQPSELGWL